MPIIEEHWRNFNDAQWRALATGYLCEIEDQAGKEFCPEKNRWGEIVVNLSFWSEPDILWKFILLALSMAEIDEQLGEIGAGPLLHLLSRDGEKYIGTVEKETMTNTNLLTALTDCFQFRMTDDVWKRVERLIETADRKLA